MHLTTGPVSVLVDTLSREGFTRKRYEAGCPAFQAQQQASLQTRVSEYPQTNTPKSC